MRKIIELEDRFSTGEATVQPAILWHAGQPYTDAFGGITKHASEALEYIKNVVPEPGKTHLLLLAMGGEETYGPNRNGDGFPARPVPAKNRNKAASNARKDWAVPPGEELVKHYQSFEKNPAHAFSHHANKNKEKASGHVKKAFWNDKMQRVELLVVIDNEKDPEWVKRVNDGEFPAVSMGCVPKGTRILMADGAYRNVEEVKECDEVITHRGRAQKVNGVMRRPHKGKIYYVKIYGHRDPLVLTEEHPLWAVSREQLVCCPPRGWNHGRFQDKCTPLSKIHNDGCKGCPTNIEYEFDWFRTDAVEAGFCLASPLPTFKTERTFTSDEARLLGYYLSEGHIIHANKHRGSDDFYVEFSLGLHEIETRDELYALADRLQAHSVSERVCEERNGRYVTIWDQRIARICSEHCGEGAKTKRLSSSLMGASPDTLKIFLGSYVNGDGGKYQGSLYLSTASRELSDQLRIVLLRCGMIASINEIFHKPSKNSVVNVETVEYQVWVGAETAPNLTTSKFKFEGIKGRPKNRRFFYTYQGVEYLLSTIEWVEPVDYDDDVYNFGVDNDESYLIDNLAVHNCRIKRDVCSLCGNEAPTRADYCSHARNQMNVILPDGSKIYVHNPSPDFFDISRVFRPADRIGYTMKKVAESIPELQLSADLGATAEELENKSAAIRKLSDLLKIIRGEPIASSSDIGNGDRLILQKLRGDGFLRDELPPEKVSAALYGLSFPELLDGARAANVVLPVDTLVKAAARSLLKRDASPREITAALRLHGPALDLLAENPHVLEELEQTGILGNFGELNEKTANLFELMRREAVPEGIGLRRDAGANTDLIQRTDPRTGQVHMSTRGTALAAQDAQTRNDLGRALGGAALLVGGAHALTGMPWLSRKIRWPAAALMGYAGTRLLRPAAQTMPTDTGLQIPTITEFAPQQKLSSDGVGPLTLRFLCDAPTWTATPTVKVATPIVSDLDAAIDFLETLYA